MHQNIELPEQMWTHLLDILDILDAPPEDVIENLKVFTGRAQIVAIRRDISDQLGRQQSAMPPEQLTLFDPTPYEV